MDLVLRNVAVHRDSFQLSMEDLTLTLPRGTITLVLGTAGSGKSTLLHTAAGFIRPEVGSVEYGGHSLWSGKGKHWNPTLKTGIGLLTDQPDHQFFAATIKEELLYSLHGIGLESKEAILRIQESLAAVGLANDEASLLQSPFSLSGGQKRRLALAAALLLDPSWIMLDEPSVGLDAEGIHQLADKLRDWPKRGGGVLVATHDAAAFWPIADQILVLDHGQAVFFGVPGEIVRDLTILRNAGLGVPAQMEVAERLRNKGLEMPSELLSPEQLAALLASQLGVYPITNANPPDIMAQTTPHREVEYLQQNLINRLDRASTSPDQLSSDSVPNIVGPLAAYDPRAVWVFLLAATLGVWQQIDWLGLLVGTAITLVVVLYSRISIRTLIRLSRAYAIFLAFTIILAGLKWTNTGSLMNHIDFSWVQAEISFTRLYRLYLALWLGFLLPLTQSHLRIKRALEQSLRPFARIGLPVEAFSLTTSLLFRFIPLIGGEWLRFGQLARVRKRAIGRTDRLAIRDLRPLLVPFLLSLLRLADQVAYALEARGYARTGAQRTHAITFQFVKKDVLLMVIGVLLAIGLSMFALR